jgi:chromosome segregation ATPase
MSVQASSRPWTVPSGSLTSRGPSQDGGMMSSTSTLVGGGQSQSQTPQELDELHRKYRIMELTRKQSNEESANTLRMQRQQIEKLKKDNDRLKEDLALETRQARQANNMSATAQIAKLQDQGDIYTRKIETEKRRLEDLDKSIKKMQNSILVQRKEMGGINATRESNHGVQKQIRILENRLDKALVKFNEALAHNKSLRDQIDNLRRERIVFDAIYNKLNRELDAKKRAMNDIMTEANHAYEQRNTAQMEMIHLKEQADREQLHFEEEWKQLGVLIDKDRKMKDFMNKSKERERMIGGKGVDPAIEEEQTLRKKVTKGAWGIAADKANIHLSMEKVQSYEEAFAKIQKATKITDIDELVHTFVHAEDQNFSLFNYVNDLSNEIEKLEEQISTVKSETTKYRGAGENNDAARKKLIAELEAKLTKNHAKARTAEERFASSSKTLHSLKAGVGNIFQRLGCANIAASELLGNAGVTESNMMQYLGIIEQRTNELLTLYQAHRVEAGQSNDAYGNTFARTARLPSSHLPSNQPVHSSPSESLSIHAPSALGGEEEDGEGEDGEDGDGEDVQPMSREEMMQRQQQRQYDQQTEEY